MTLTQWREIEKETETEKDILIFKRFQQLKDEQAILEKEINQYWIEFGDIVDSLLLQVDKDSPSTFSTEINKINSADISLLISAAKMVEQLIIHKVTVGEALTTFEMDARTIIRNIYKKLDKYGARLAEVINEDRTFRADITEVVLQFINTNLRTDIKQYITFYRKLTLHLPE